MVQEGEYPVEHLHEQTRGETNEYNTAEKIHNKLLRKDTTKVQLHNFRSWFLPPTRSNYIYSHSQLRSLKVEAAKFLLSIIKTSALTHSLQRNASPDPAAEEYHEMDSRSSMGLWSVDCPERLATSQLPVSRSVSFRNSPWS